ncbi:MAG: methyltransferase domain-containing protein [Acidobacteria bacterium]|nr:methyltransferase domain-containing protein [Acidobacteriota bacterium]MBV9475518.1 methyltransferase domain-containing protein [Acidobacteriota bacterium]
MTMIEDSVGAGVYAARIARTLNSGFTALMLSVGHRTGLFDVMAALPPATSADIARTSGLSERYVREWLAAMTAAHIVDHDARTMTYFLPIEYAAVLTRGASSANLAPFAQLLGILGGLEDLVVTAFRSGGGIPAEAYERVQEVLAGEKRLLIDDEYVDALLDLIPDLHLRLAAGGTILDAGCGDGTLAVALARRFPRAIVRGYDVSSPMIARARERADEAGVHNIRFELYDLSRFEERDAYDLVIALDAIHELAFPRLVLRRLAASLRRDGAFVMQELAASSQLAKNDELPHAPMLYALSTLQTVPAALAEDGEPLGRIWGRERATYMLGEAGFARLRFARLACDTRSDYWIACVR